jgi:hypothetical protein
MQTSIHSQGRRIVFTRRLARRYNAAVRQAQRGRASVAAACRVMLRGVSEKAAWLATVAYYRSGVANFTANWG